MTFNLLRNRRLILKVYIQSMLSRRLFLGTVPVTRLNNRKERNTFPDNTAYANVRPSKDNPPRRSFFLECATNMNQFAPNFEESVEQTKVSA
jgi:hypothetical protein